MGIILLGLFILMHVGEITHGQYTTMSQNGCSYTFFVPKQDRKSCHSGSVDMNSNSEEMHNLKATIRGLQEQVLVLSQTGRYLQEKIEQLGVVDQANRGMTVATYVRWGRTVCPQSAEIVYQGKIVKQF